MSATMFASHVDFPLRIRLSPRSNRESNIQIIFVGLSLSLPHTRYDSPHPSSHPSSPNTKREENAPDRKFSCEDAFRQALRRREDEILIFNGKSLKFFGFLFA